MTRRSRLLSLFLGLTLAAGCSGLRVNTDFDPSFPFAQLGRYAWLPDPPDHSSHPQLHNSLIDGRVRGSVDRQLAERGFKQVSAEEADFLVNYYLGLETRFDTQTVSSGVGYGRRGWYGGAHTETRVTQFEEGSLLLDFLDPDRNLIWRGSARARVREKSSPQQREQRIDEAVQAILERFPPS
jgi:hypothetical protein